MNDTSAASLLREAAAKIETALVKLDMRHRMCRNCGHTTHDNRTHYGAYQKLTDTPYKLRQIADSLEK